MAEATLNGTGLGNVSSINISKSGNIVALPMPGQDSDSTFIYDAFGVTQYITITGTQTNATLATLITFATTIKALIDGLQSSTVNLVTDQEGTIAVLVDTFDYTWDTLDNKIDYTIRLVQGTTG
jgi:hypothetical protein|tara:strand:- start:18104 stop:18475 length:372 start_codon:yes stop_codon:yes gene_type:complete